MGGLFREAARAALERRLQSSIGLSLIMVFGGAMGVVLARSDSEATALRVSLGREVSPIVEIRAGPETPVLPDWLQATVAELTGVEAAIGLGPVTDVFHSASGRGPMPLRVLTGGEANLGIGPCSAPYNTAVVDARAAEALGLSGPTGALVARPGSRLESEISLSRVISVDSSWRRVPGAYTTCSFPDGGATSTVTVLVLATDLSNVAQIDRLVRRLVQPIGADISVESAADVVEFRAALAAEAAVQRTLTIRVMIVALLGMSLAIGSVAGISRRQNYGRTRALGATRGDLATLVLVEAVLVALVGSAVSALSSVAIHLLFPGLWVDLSWLPAVVLLGVLTAVGGMLPAVVSASVIDPVKVLRQP